MHQVNKIKNFLKNRPAISVIIIFAVVGTAYLVATNAAAPSVPNGYTQVFLDDFNGSSVDTSKWNVITGTEGHSQAYYTSNNVSVSNGNAVIRTRRHCVNSTSDTLNDSNASVAACASGKTTVYSSGQLRTGNIFPEEGRIEVRAKLPTTQLGLWPAIWMRNQSAWCTSNYGELDTMEWYGDYPTVNTSTSHITCANGSTKMLQHNDHVNTVDLSNDYHVWVMDWSEDGIKYYMDGVLLPHVKTQGDSDRNVDSYTDFSGVSQSQFSAILNQMWQLRLNTQVTSSDSSSHIPPNNSQSFQSVDFLIDYVRVMVPDDNPPPPTGTCPVWSYKGQSNGVNIDEASGIVASRKQPGIFWMHNDSGGTNQIWAVDSTGKVVSRHVLSGAAAQDWEDISLGPGPDSSKDYVYVGDVGDNARARTDAKVYRVPEPTVNPSDNNAQYTISSSLLHTFALSYKLADGSSIKPDVEAMAVDPLTKDIYFFNKSMNSRDQNGVNGKSHVFKLDGSGLTGSGNFTPTEIANVVGNVDSQSSSQYPPGFTAADISADGQMLVAQNYDEIFIWNRSGGSTFVNSLNTPSDGLAPCYYSDSDISGSTIPGSEAVTFSPNGRELSFITEGNGSRIRTFENTNVGGNPDTQPPSVPSGLSGSAPSTNQVNLNWSASTDNVGVSGYNIYRNGTKITNISGTSYNDTSVSANTTYSYTVSAYDAAGNTSAQSSSVSVTTPNNQSTKLGNVNNLTAIAQDGQVTLNWDAVNSANNYTVRWGTGGSWSNYSNDQSNSNNPTTNTYTVTGLTNGTTYNFAVAARDSTGAYTNGDYSSTVTATPEATPVTKLGDADGDGDVDLVDLARLLSDYGKSGSPADFNDNGVVDLADLAALLSNYGK